MSDRAAIMRLIGVSLIWGCNYVVSSYLLHGFSPIFLSFVRICMTSVFLIVVGLLAKGMRWPNKKEWGLLAGAGVFGTLMNQTFYFTGLHHSTAGNAALIIALVPIATTILARIFLKESLTPFKITGAAVGLAGVVTIVFFGGNGGLNVGIGDAYLLLAMLTQAISLLFIRWLTEKMSSFAVTIYSTVLGAMLMSLPAGVEHGLSGTVVSHQIWLWLLMAAAGIFAQGIAGFWWNNGVAVVGASTASMFMNIPPFIALIVGHFVLGDPIHVTQVVGGMLVLAGVAVANRKPSSGEPGGKVKSSKPVVRNGAPMVK